MSAEPFLSINEVSTRLDLPAYTLRYWEKQFPSAIKPTTGAGGRRYYRSETVATLETVKDLLYNRGMTIAGVKKLIKEGNLESAAQQTVASKPVPRAAPNKSDVDGVIELLEKAKAILQ